MLETFSLAAQALAVASFLAVAAKSIVQAVAEPVRKKFPNLDMWWLIYVTWAVGGLLSWAAGVDVFSMIIPEFNTTVGKLLTAVVVGGGSSLIHDIFDPD